MSLEKIVLIRHAQSMEDADSAMHNLAEDTKICLTAFGVSQAEEMLALLSNDPVSSRRAMAWVSPSFRAQATWAILRDAFPRLQGVATEPRIRNLNWGSITAENRAAVESERYAAGVLNYAFPGGDDTPAYARAIDDFVREALHDRGSSDFPECAVIVTHGFAFRLIARSILGISDAEFRLLANPANCFCAEIRHDPDPAVAMPFSLLTPLPIIRHAPRGLL